MCRPIRRSYVSWAHQNAQPPSGRLPILLRRDTPGATKLPRAPAEISTFNSSTAMNDIGPTGGDARGGASDYRDEVDACVSRHPESAVLAALLGGLLLGLLFLLLRPTPDPRRRTARLLEEMQDQVRSLAKPLMKRTSRLASKGSKHFAKSARRGEGLVERWAHDATDGFKRLLR